MVRRLIYIFAMSAKVVREGWAVTVVTQPSRKTLMSAIKWQVRFVDCSLIYADLGRLFVFTTLEFFCAWIQLQFFEFETIYENLVKRWAIQWKFSCHILAGLAK